MANPFAIDFEEGFPVFNIPATATATVTIPATAATGVVVVRVATPAGTSAPTATTTLEIVP